MPVELRRGALAVAGSGLHLDARRQVPLSFVSHAHTDHIARHAHAIATPETLALMEHRLGHLEARTPLRFNEPHRVEGLTITLLPAGHVLGAAQVLVERPDGHHLVYTGDWSPTPSLTAARAEVVACDTLVIEATFGHPRYVFPPREAVYDDVVSWAKRAQSQGATPVLFAYSLGKSQETIAQLTARGMRVVAHAGIVAMSAIYDRLGVNLAVRAFDGSIEPGEVLLFPPNSRAQLAQLPRVTTAALTGWALERWGARRSGADIAFAISDHADFAQLVHYAVESKAREVITLYGFAEDLAKHLKARGIFARAVTERVQMALPL